MGQKFLEMNRTLLALPFVACIFFALGCATTPKEPDLPSGEVRAEEVITVADDFIVNIYHNGVRVPEEKRELLLDRFGATVERIDLNVRAGDWIVFHVVNNRLRWDGAYYFGVAGLFSRDHFGFVSELVSGNWSVCDDPAQVRQFITQKNYLRHNRAVPVERPWHEGTELMKKYAGETWPGTPIWGRERSTWIKVAVP